MPVTVSALGLVINHPRQQTPRRDAHVEVIDTEDETRRR
jgi:hypothetical protein